MRGKGLFIWIILTLFTSVLSAQITQKLSENLDTTEVKVKDKPYVTQQPHIKYFTAAPAILQLGQSLTLNWRVTDAISAGILPGIGTVEPEGSLALMPTSSITYTLKAVGWDTVIQRSVSISVEPAPEILSPPPPMLRKQGDKVILSIQFKTNSQEIPESAEADLNDLFRVLKKLPRLVVQITGHTDRKGNEEFNTKLSFSRAESVQTYLIEKGIEPTRLFVSGVGSSEPLMPNTSREGRLKNRRIEITVLTD